MDAVFGTWKVKPGSEKNYDAFFQTMGISAAEAEAYQKREIHLTFSKEGGKFKMSEVVMNDSNKLSASYVYELDKELDTVDIDGAPLKMLMKWDGSKFQETYTYKDASPIQTTREVCGGVMKVAMTVKGVTASDEWEKC